MKKSDPKLNNFCNTFKPGHMGSSHFIRSITIEILFLLWVSLTNASPLMTQGPKQCQCVALTFDLCPVKSGSGYDKGVINFLIENKIPATFFVSGRWIETHRQQLEKLLKIDHFEFGVHGHYHSHLKEKSPDRQLFEIENPLKILRQQFNYVSNLFRPGFGEYNEVTLNIVEKLGLKMILWTIESGDADPHLSVQRILEELYRRTKSGSIIPFHANGNAKHTAEILPRFVNEKIKKDQLKLVKIGQMLSPNQTH